MHHVGLFLLVMALGGARFATAQETVPLLIQSFPDQPLAPGGAAVTIDARNFFGAPGFKAGAELVQFDTVFGRFNVELRRDAAPLHVASFLAYVEASAYANSVVHRAAALAGTPISIIQGGAYRNPPNVVEISRRPPVPLEYNLPHLRGTLAAARGADVDSATSEWFINVRDNSTLLGPANAGGYTVFGRVLGSGMGVVDQMAALPRINGGAGLAELPVRNYSGGPLAAANFVVINSIQAATLFPIGDGASVLELTVENSAPAVVGTLLSGSTLTLTPLAPGNAVITIRVFDPQGNAAFGRFNVTIPATAPVFSTQPDSQVMSPGSTVVFRANVEGAAGLRWAYNGATIVDESDAVLVLSNVNAAQAGRYTVTATNALGEVTSRAATLTVREVAPMNRGRLANLSILTNAGGDAGVLTMGAVVGPFDAPGALPVVVRAVGPALAPAPFNVPGVLSDPVLTLFSAQSTTPLETNDDWGGGPATAAAFTAVGAFSLPDTSRDAALVRPAPGVSVGGYTVQISGKGSASGRVLAEIYDAAGSNRTSAAPRLINVSTLAQVAVGADLAAGFVIVGETARTVLIRGVGPSLARLGVSGVMPDPRLELYNNDTGQRIGGNDDWAGALEVSATGGAVGAFALLGGTSKDAALLVTLSPGAYSARISGGAGPGGTVIVEVYEVP